jgi:hypothetical protein
LVASRCRSGTGRARAFVLQPIWGRQRVERVRRDHQTGRLETIYEQEFLPCSYGFRPGRSAHRALNSLRHTIWSKRLYWVLEIDSMVLYKSSASASVAAGWAGGLRVESTTISIIWPSAV